MKFASFLSYATEPMFLFLVFAISIGWRVGLRDIQLVSYIFYLFVIFFCIWMTRMFLVRSLKTNWDVSERPKRVRLLLLLMCFSGLFFSSLFLYRNAQLLRMSGMLFLWLLGFFFITLKKKISGHMAVTTLVASHWWPLYALIPFVGWSRIVLKRHTIGEVIGGFVYSIIWLLLAQRFLVK